MGLGFYLIKNLDNMKKSIWTIVMAITCSLNCYAQADGFYHIQNTVTGRYISINDTDPSNYQVSQAGDVNMGGIRTYLNYDTVAISPSCIIFVKSLGDGNWDLVAQGSSLYQMANQKLKINLIANGNDSYKISGTAKGITKTLADGSPSQSDSWMMNRLTTTQNWWFRTINTSDEYIGIKPDVKTADGLYYGTVFCGFNLKVSEGMAAYYVSNAGGTGFTLKQFEDNLIPAGTPAVVRCNSSDPKDNKIEPIIGGYSFNAVNWLGGVYCSIKVSRHNNVTPYDPTTMRVIGLNDEGKLAFVKAKSTDLYKELYLFGNKAYLKVGNDAADVLTEGGYSAIDNVRTSVVEDNSLYTLTGIRIPDDVTPRSGIYIKNGKKIIIK